jgi:hypothetical protein
MAVEGMTLFTKTFGEPISAPFLQDPGTRQRTQLTLSTAAIRIRKLATPQKGVPTEADEIAEALYKKLRSSRMNI